MQLRSIAFSERVGLDLRKKASAAKTPAAITPMATSPDIYESLPTITGGENVGGADLELDGYWPDEDSAISPGKIEMTYMKTDIDKRAPDPGAAGGIELDRTVVHDYAALNLMREISHHSSSNKSMNSSGKRSKLKTIDKKFVYWQKDRFITISL